MSFIAAVEHQVGIFEHLPERFRARTQSFRDEVGALMTGVPEPLRSHRILQVCASASMPPALGSGPRRERFEVLPSRCTSATCLTDGRIPAGAGLERRPRVHQRVSNRDTRSAVPRVMVASGLLSVGFIGPGSQGAPMARRITGRLPTTLWARRQESLEPFGSTAAKHGTDTCGPRRGFFYRGHLCERGGGAGGGHARDRGVLAGRASGGTLAVH